MPGRQPTHWQGWQHRPGTGSPLSGGEMDVGLGEESEEEHDAFRNYVGIYDNNFDCDL